MNIRCQAIAPLTKTPKFLASCHVICRKYRNIYLIKDFVLCSTDAITQSSDPGFFFFSSLGLEPNIMYLDVRKQEGKLGVDRQMSEVFNLNTDAHTHTHTLQRYIYTTAIF